MVCERIKSDGTRCRQEMRILGEGLFCPTKTGIRGRVALPLNLMTLTKHVHGKAPRKNDRNSRPRAVTSRNCSAELPLLLQATIRYRNCDRKTIA